MIAAAIHCNAANYLRVNQIGYLVDDVKVAVIMMEHGDAPTSFCVVNADSGKKTVMHSVKPTGEFAGFAQTYNPQNETFRHSRTSRLFS